VLHTAVEIPGWVEGYFKSTKTVVVSNLNLGQSLTYKTL